MVTATPSIDHGHDGFDPSLWGDTFLQYSVDEQLQDKYSKAIERLKEQVETLLISGGSTKNEKLKLIDTLERLGVGYHFKNEIQEQLQLMISQQSHSDPGKSNMDLEDSFIVALEFRLLRQHFFPVSCGVFNKFKDEKSKFNQVISGNAEGLLSLYEAAQARIHGEEILDEAVPFAVHHLQRILPQLEFPLQDRVKQALDQSVHRSIPILEARRFITIYEKDIDMNELLLKFAKVNFNFLQNLYKKELCDICRWWKEIDLISGVPFTRDRLVECYFWGVGFHCEPQYSFVRSAVAKSMQLITVLDDTYDKYATIEDARLFMDILERWDADEIDPLPDYMKIIYRLVLGTYEDFEREAAQEERSFAHPYTIEIVKQTVRAYLKELEWFKGRQMPTHDLHLANSMATSGIYWLVTMSLVGMKSVSEEAIKWFVNGPKMAIVAASLGRYIQDVSSYARESKECQAFTAVECYMNQHSMSKENAIAKFIEEFEYSWKDVNTEMVNSISTSSMPRDVIDMILKYVRLAETTYKNGEDGFTNPVKNLAPKIVSLFKDPIIL